MVDLDDSGVAAALVRLHTGQVSRGDLGEQLMNEIDLFDGAVGVRLDELLRKEPGYLAPGVKAAS